MYLGPLKEQKNICIMVQARLNSERLNRKMILPFCGTTLFDIICSKLQTISRWNEPWPVYVSVCEHELVEIAEKYSGVNIYRRGQKSANCDNGLATMYEWWDQIPHTHVVLVNGCLPFLTTDTIDRFTNAYDASECDGMFGVIPKKDYFWNESGQMLNTWPEGQDLLNTKAVETTYQAAHALYGSRMDWIGQGKFVGSYTKENDPVLFPLHNQYELLDIDEGWQFEMCQKLYED